MSDGVREYPAFPVRISNDDGTSTHYVGMALLDYFAGQALPAVIQKSNRPPDEETRKYFAEESYRIADAMRKARAALRKGETT